MFTQLIKNKGSLKYLNRVGVDQSLRSQFQHLSRQIDDLELSEAPRISLAEEHLRQLEKEKSVNSELEHKARKQIKYIWKAGDTAALPLFLKHVETQYNKDQFDWLTRKVV